MNLTVQIALQGLLNTLTCSWGQPFHPGIAEGAAEVQLSKASLDFSVAPVTPRVQLRSLVGAGLSAAKTCVGKSTRAWADGGGGHKQNPERQGAP